MILFSGLADSRDFFFYPSFPLAVRIHENQAQKMLHRGRVPATVRLSQEYDGCIPKRPLLSFDKTLPLITHLPTFTQPLPLPGSGGTKVGNSWSLLTNDHGIAKLEEATMYNGHRALSSPQESSATLSTSHTLNIMLFHRNIPIFFRGETSGSNK